MRILIAIPHYYGAAADGGQRHGSQRPDSESRREALERAILSLHQVCGNSQAIIRHADRTAVPANQQLAHEVHVLVVTHGDAHLIPQLRVSPRLYHHLSTDDAPLHLGFHCQRALRDRWGNYDFYGYLEDDLIVHDPWLFHKLRWFCGHVGGDKLLLPNRFERAAHLAYHKCYLDGDLAPRVTAPFQDRGDVPQLSSAVLGVPIKFQRPLNPHSGCYFLSAEQLAHWMKQPSFGVPDSAFVGPLESAATLGIMRAFKVYKPAVENASFLEIEHAGSDFIRLIRRPPQA